MFNQAVCRNENTSSVQQAAFSNNFFRFHTRIGTDIVVLCEHLKRTHAYILYLERYSPATLKPEVLFQMKMLYKFRGLRNGRTNGEKNQRKSLAGITLT